MRDSPTLKRSVASLLAALLTGTAPGFEFYSAWAQQAVSIQVPVNPAGSAGVSAMGSVGAMAIPAGALSGIKLNSLGQTFKSIANPAPSVIPAKSASTRHSGVSRNPGRSSESNNFMDPGFRRGDGLINRLQTNTSIQKLTKPETATADKSKTLNSIFDNNTAPTPADSTKVSGAESPGSKASGLQKPAIKSMDLWETLEQQISVRFDLKLDPGKTKEWRSLTGEWLRNNPADSLETALAKTMVRIHSLSPEITEKIASSISNPAILTTTLPGPGQGYHVISAGTNLYAEGEEGLFIHKNNQWESLGTNFSFSFMPPREFDGKLYMSGNDSVIYEVDADRIRPIIHAFYFGAPVKHAGEIYLPAFTQGLLKRNSEGKWEQVPEFVPGKITVRSLIEVGKDLFADTDRGVYKQVGNTWELAIADTRLAHLVTHNGKLHVVDRHPSEPHRLVFRELNGNNAKPIAEIDATSKPFNHDGHLYVHTMDNNLVELDENNQWTHRLAKTWLPELLKYGKELYVSSYQEGLFKVENDHWRRIHHYIGKIHGIVEIHGKRYAAAETGLYSEEDSTWKLILSDKDISSIPRGITSIAKEGNRLYLGTLHHGIKEIEFNDYDLPASWKNTLLEDISRDIAQSSAAKEKSDSDAEKPAPDSSTGEIFNKEGRAVSSGFANRIADALGGVARHLQRNLMRAAPAADRDGAQAAVKPMQPKPGQERQPDLWPILERYVADGLEIELEPGKTEAWIKAAQEVLRNHPATKLETAMAQALARTHSLDDNTLNKIAEILEGPRAAESLGGMISDVLKINNNVYALTDEGLYILKQKKWKRLVDTWVIPNRNTYELDGKLYVGNPRFLYEVDGERVTIIANEIVGIDLLPGIPVRYGGKVVIPYGNKLYQKSETGKWTRLSTEGRVAAVLGKDLFIGTDKGIVKRTGERWSPVTPHIGEIKLLVEHNGRIYASGESQLGIHELDADGKTRFSKLGPVKTMFKHGGHLYAQAGEALYALGPDKKWIRVLQDLNPTGSSHASFNEELYVETQKGLFRNTDGKWRRIHKDIGKLAKVFEYEGSQHIAAESGLYKIEGNRLELVYDDESILNIAESKGKLYIATYGSVYKLLLYKDLPKRWKPILLKDLSSRISSVNATSKNSGQEDKKPTQDDSTGEIFNKEGRAISSGFGKRIVSAKKEPLAKQAKELQKPEMTALELWESLASQLSGHLGLGLELTPDKTRAWISTTRELLRSDPTLKLEATMAQALAKVHSLDAASEKKAASLLTAPILHDSLNETIARRFLRAKNNLYAVTNPPGTLYRDIYLYDKNPPTGGTPHWRRIKQEIFPFHAHRFEDKLYFFGGTGSPIEELNGERSRPIAAATDYGMPVRHKGRIYIPAFYSGLFEKTEQDRWRKIKELPGKIRVAAEINGELYAGGDGIVYKKRGNLWQEAYRVNGDVEEIIGHAGKIYILAHARNGDARVYEKSSAQELRLMDLTGVRHLFTHAGRLYSIANSWPKSQLVTKLYELKDQDWTDVFTTSRFYYSPNGYFPDGAKVYTPYGEELYVTDPNGYAHKLVDAQERPMPEGIGEINAMIEYAGKRYAATMSGLYEIDGDRWTQLLQEVILDITQEDGQLLAGTYKGIKRMIILEGLPYAWKDIITDQLSKDIAQSAASEGKTGPDTRQPAPDDSTGEILNKEGRSVSSGLRTVVGAVLSRWGLDFRNAAEPNGSDGNKDPHILESVEKQLDALMEKYKVPPGDRGLRKKLTLQAVTRITLDIALFTGNPDLPVRFGTWWLTLQDLINPRLKEILIPLEDIFVRAVDPVGVEEAVGAAIHEMAHYSITRADPSSPLTEKYVLTTSPEANNLLYQALEDTIVNTWALLHQPGFKPYFDAIYDQMWPENPEDTQRIRQERIDMLSRSTLRIELPGQKEEAWMPPHIQYADSIIYHWRFPGKIPLFLTDPKAREAFQKTLPSLDKIRNIQPADIGGVIPEEMKNKAAQERLEVLDSEIYPYYKELIDKSLEDLKNMLEKGGQAGPPHGQSMDGNGNGEDAEDDGNGSPAGNPSKAKPSKSRNGKGSPASAKDILDRLDQDLAKELGNHGHQKGKAGNQKQPAIPDSGEDQPAAETDQDKNPDRDSGSTDKNADQSEDASQDQGNEGGKEWKQLRDKLIRQENALRKSFTTYDRYKLRAQELGLIGKIDGIVKKILLPTKHARLSRNLYHEGDEPDLNKYYDDAAQGRYDTPIMRRWNRKIRRTAKISLALDISGSMGNLTQEMTSPLDYAFLGIVAWIEVCQKNNLDFEVILFDELHHTVHPFNKTVNHSSKEHILQEILKRSGGSTAIGRAFKAALDSILKQQATHRFVIFATDEGQNTGEEPGAWTALAKKNRVVTFAMVIGQDSDGYKKHFDYAVRVKEPEDFPTQLMEVLQKAIRAILGPVAGFF